MQHIQRHYKKILILASMLLLSGCSQQGTGQAGSSLWDIYIIQPLSQFIIWLSSLFANQYAIGIILFTLLIRILLIPLNNMQMKSQRKLQEIQPELDAIKAKYPNKDRHSMEQLQEEQSALMEKRGVNQFAGCLPLLVQFPVMIALYQTIQRTEILRQGHFLWMNLGQRDPYLVLPILAAVFSFLSTYLMMKAAPSSNSANKVMTYVMPVIIFMIAFGLPSALGLYFVVTNLFTVVQVLIFNNPYKIIREREEKIQMEKDRQRELRRQLRRATGKNKK